LQITNIVKRTAGYYLGEEQQKVIEGAELHRWKKDMEMI
jgi:hypothetical protein